ncbi:hypothetical protein JTB14_034389 [Gonioctena quinquepunctata]|nr:hypothetical protein JTB14_034389 [Gonioctena quinquepunctata]
MAVRKSYLCLISLLIVIPGNCAPKSKKNEHSPHTVYDQKQTGDYNIQLHLKDFQIIAVLGDDSSSFGDYDYNYDYSDFTVKPITQKPTEPSPPTPTPIAVIPSSTFIPEKPSTSSIKPSNHPYPILLPSTESSKEKEPMKAEEISTPTEKPSVETTSKQSVDVSKEKTSSTTLKSPRKEESSSPGKIKVQILETPVNLSIVSGEELHDQSETLPQNEFLQQKRCASGFARDKRGRCRRVRRPGNATQQLPYGFSRLASNLASRLRQASSETSSSSSESFED